jgi:tRNA U54 and U55 pseudouridine synthase Pus10
MALSEKVKDSLEEAQNYLRTALHHAARSEKPVINKQISDCLVCIDSIIKYENIADNLEQKLKDFGFKGDFF